MVFQDVVPCFNMHVCVQYPFTIEHFDPVPACPLLNAVLLEIRRFQVLAQHVQFVPAKIVSECAKIHFEHTLSLLQQDYVKHFPYRQPKLDALVSIGGAFVSVGGFLTNTYSMLTAHATDGLTNDQARTNGLTKDQRTNQGLTKD